MLALDQNVSVINAGRVRPAAAIYGQSFVAMETSALERNILLLFERDYMMRSELSSASKHETDMT